MFQFERLQDPYLLLGIPVILFSLTVHECAHAYVALRGGDDTSSLQGRISLNPLVHIDPIGTIVLPLLSILSNFPFIGWAKPVPVNPSRLKNSMWMVYVAAAGPISNVLIALTSTLILFLLTAFIGADNLPPVVKALGQHFIVINVALAVFNMIPVPPLDGSKLAFHFFVNGRPERYPAWEFLERFNFMILYLIILLPITTKLLGLGILIPARALLNLSGI